MATSRKQRRRTAQTTHVRSVEITHTANRAKVREVSEYMSVVRSAMIACKQDKIADLRAGGKVRRFTKDEWRLAASNSRISARLLKSVENNVNDALRAWQEMAVCEGRAIITAWRDAGYVDDDCAHDLYTTNLMKQWWNADQPHPALRKELIVLILKHNPFPVFRGTGVRLDVLVAQIKEHNHAKHELWCEIRGVDGKVIEIPVSYSPYAKQQLAQGEVCSTIALHIDRDGQLHIRKAVKRDNAPRRTTGQDIGVDWGLHTLVSTSHGQLHGRMLYDWLVARDAELTELGRRLQQLGIRPRDSRRYRAMQRRITAYVKNEIGRVLNKLAAQDIRSITVERLDFRFGGLSKKLNRIVQRAGRRAFKEKLHSITQTHGIEINEVNPAYTSQQCSGCGHIARQSRNGTRYACVFCGKRLHADINAAKNILTRRSRDTYWQYKSKEHILSQCQAEFYQRWNMHRSLADSSDDTPLAAGLLDDRVSILSQENVFL